MYFIIQNVLQLKIKGISQGYSYCEADIESVYFISTLFNNGSLVYMTNRLTNNKLNV